ncbi:MAG: hypothetical protein K6C40_02035, partial [Thermoguttaceae bacterium]|nr:hypothetical protein [Thermoguttaceae bacterium]
VASGDSLIGSGTATYSSTSTGTEWNLTNMNASTFTGTEIFTKGRFQVNNQSQVGSSETPPTIIVQDGAQLWLKAGQNIKANISLSGHGRSPSDYNGVGALRFEEVSSLGGSVTLAADSTISTFYNTQTEAHKTMASTVALEGHTLYLGSGPDYDPNLWQDKTYWFTGLTVSGKVSGSGKLVINNTSGKSNIVFSNTENDFTAPIEILHGSLKINDVRALGQTTQITVKNSGNLTVAAGSGTASGLPITVESGGTVQLSGSGITGTTVDLPEGAKLTVSTLVGVTITGNGIVQRGSEDGFANVNATNFHGTVQLTSGRARIANQSKLGATDVTVNVPSGAQLWLIGAGTVTGTFNIAGDGYGTVTSNDQLGAVRLETNSSMAGQINLDANATISTWYNTETSKKILANVNLNEYTLTLGAPSSKDMGAWIPTETQGRQFTQLTVQGEISGTGGLRINNQKPIYLKTAADYTGATTIQYGEFALDAADAIALSVSVSVAEGGSVTFSQDQTLQNLSGAGNVTGAAGKNLTLKYTGTGSDAFTGKITLGEGGKLTYVNDSDSGRQTQVNSLVTETLTIGFTSNSADEFLVDSFAISDVGQIQMKDLGEGTELAGLNYPILKSAGGLPEYDDWTSLLTDASREHWYLYASGDTLFAAVDGNTVPEPAAWLLLLLGVFFLRRAGKR